MVFKNKYCVAFLFFLILFISFTYVYFKFYKKNRFSSEQGYSYDKQYYLPLIDNLSKENILKTPLANYHSKLILPGRKLFEINGIRGNPYLIKRKISILNPNFITVNSIYSPPESIYRFSIKLSQKSILELNYGYANDKPENIKFIIQISDLKNNKILFHKFFIPKKNNYFYNEKINLSFLRNKEIFLYLITEGSREANAFWINPIIYEPNQNGYNILLISLDTLRADHLNLYGYNRDTSPFMNSLAKESVVFLNAIAPSSWTLPSHISLITSLYPRSHNVIKEDNILESQIITLAQILRNHKFFCAAFTGGGFLNSHYGFAKGFDFYQENKNDAFAFNAAKILASFASDWLNSNKDKKFFLFLHTYQIHNPYFSPPPFNTFFLNNNNYKKHINLEAYLGGKEFYFKPLSKEEKENIISLYDGEIRYTDESLIHPIIRELKKLKIYDKTMIIITSDHGEEFYEHRAWLHGHDLYNEVIRIPLIIKFPYSKYKAKIIKTPVSSLDIFPTILSFFNINYTNYKIDGENLIPIISGKERKNPFIFSEVDKNIFSLHNTKKIAVIKSSDKLIYNEPYSYEEAKFFSYAPPDKVKIEFFNLNEDPEEKNNLFFKNTSSAINLFNIMKKLYYAPKPFYAKKVPLTKELIEELKALGYLK